MTGGNPLAGMEFDPALQVPLPSGRQAEFTVEDLVEMQNRIRDLITEAYEARYAARASAVDMTSFGLRPADFAPGALCFTLPDALGSLPFGVPMIRFNPAPRPNMYFRGSRDDTQSDVWQLVLSSPNTVGIPLSYARHDDYDGIVNLVAMLRDGDPETLSIQLALTAETYTHPGHRGGPLHEEVIAYADRLLATAATTPAIDEDTFAALRAARYTVHPVLLIDPATLRLVRLPHMIRLVSTGHAYVADLDKALSRVGLVGLTNRSGQEEYGVTARYATVRRHGAKMGALPEQAFSTIVPDRPDGNLFERRNNTWGVAHAGVLTLEERDALLARGAVTA